MTDCKKFLRGLAATALTLFSPAALWAACEGTDLRASLDADDIAAVEAQIAATPYAEGNHWIARKDGRVVHLIGTMHFNDPRFDAVEARLEPVVESADAVLFETTPEDMRAFQRSLAQDFSPVLLTEGPTLPEMMSEEGWARLSDAARARGMPPWMMAKMRPWFLSITLSIPRCVHSIEDGENGLDRRLGAMADRMGIRQVSLEQVADVIRLFEEDPLEEQVRQIELSIPMLAGIGDGNDAYVTLADGYFEGKVAETMLVQERATRRDLNVPPGEIDRLIAEFYDTIFRKRNLSWMPAILSHPGERIVVAVGAGHLSGEYGLLTLLNQEGYDLTRAEF